MAAPYGVYVLNDNTGFVNLGTEHDTAEFAAESILRWWTVISSFAPQKGQRSRSGRKCAMNAENNRLTDLIEFKLS